MRSLVIGGAGFVGKYLVRYLLELKHEVIITKMPMEEARVEGAAVYDLDILDKATVAELLEKISPDLVFHLAAQSSVSMSWKNPQQTVDVNVKGSVNVLDGLRSMKKKARILLIGSGEEYGQVIPSETPVCETSPLRPGNIYAATKACQNMIGRIYAQAYGMNLVLVDGDKYKDMIAARMKKENGRGSWMVYASCDREYAEQVTMKMIAPLAQAEQLIAQVTERTAGKARIEEMGEVYYGVANGEVFLL